MQSAFLQVFKKECKIKIEAIIDDIKARRDPDFFWQSGTQIYEGRQGSGKTISAVYGIKRLKNRYPKCILVSNLKFTTTYLKPLTFNSEDELKTHVEFLQQSDNAAKYYILFSDLAEMTLALVKVNNGKYGVLFIIDEIHTYFNSVADGGSKGVPMYVFTEISQQRKQRKCIVGTSQLYMRISKPLREQCDNLIRCKTFFGFLTIQQVYEGDTAYLDTNDQLQGKYRRTGWFFQTRALRSLYDTFQKVVSSELQYEQNPNVFLQPEKRKSLGFRRG